MHKIIENQKRYLSISEFQRRSGLSYPTIKNALDTGQLKGVQTESGKWKIDTQATADKAAVNTDIAEIEQLLKSLCKHLGVDTSQKAAAPFADNFKKYSR